MLIDENLVKHLISSQFPQWSKLTIRPVAQSGWDNRTFHLGDQLSVRLPSAADYALQVEKEQRWLPILAPMVTLKIPEPVAEGKADENYPWNWSVYRWIEGESAASGKIENLENVAETLGRFLNQFHQIDASGGPTPGLHSFHRGGALHIYDSETREALKLLKDKIDVKHAAELWDLALSSAWSQRPVWVHGDISAGNLLLNEGKLSAVIDFGQLAAGDPACDLAIAWTLFQGKSRKIFYQNVELDENTWARGRAWALWKALMYLAKNQTEMNFEARRALTTINELISDSRQ